MTCCLTLQYESFWLEVRSGAPELKVIYFCLCLYCLCGHLDTQKYKTQKTRNKLKFLWSERERFHSEGQIFALKRESPSFGS